MADYIIPDQLIEGFSEFFSLSRDKIQKIADQLKIIPVGTGPETFLRNISENGEVSQNIAKIIFSFGNLLNTNSASVVAAGLCNSFVSKHSSIAISAEELIEKILIILNAGENLKLSFKAFDLLASNERLFRSARIISDVRLIFNEDLNDQNRRAIIIHNLNIDHQIDQDVKKICFALDTNDLRKLKEQIERALDEETQIKSSYQSNINFVEITE